MQFHFDIKSTTFLLFFVSLLSLAVINYVAVEFFLYWQYIWLDIPMHFLGGVVTVLGLLSLVPIHRQYGFMRGLPYVLVFALIVGLLWEAFELIAGLPVIEKGSIVQDTALDLVMDLLGGFAGYILARALRPLDEATKHPEDPSVT